MGIMQVRALGDFWYLSFYVEHGYRHVVEENKGVRGLQLQFAGFRGFSIMIMWSLNPNVLHILHEDSLTRPRMFIIKVMNSSP